MDFHEQRYPPTVGSIAAFPVNELKFNGIQIVNLVISRFQIHHLHLDIIGPLPPSQGFSYCLTAIDHFSRWPEAYPISDMTPESVTATVIRISKIRTTLYQPSSNGLMEHTHQSLEAALMAHATARWTQVLPFILLGLRSVIKEDINATAAELV
ncbi:gag-pol polyprotein [Trichonephila clavipes]|nr:gag-pol polyprotein [Trichonephila clavipes]